MNSPRFELPPPPRRRPLIIGMEPMMFWILAGVTALALFGPFIGGWIRHLIK